MGILDSLVSKAKSLFSSQPKANFSSVSGQALNIPAPKKAEPKYIYNPVPNLNTAQRAEFVEANYPKTTKVLKAGAVIGAGVAAASVLSLPGAAAAVGSGLATAGKYVAKKFVDKPIQTAAAGLVGIPTVVGIISAKPSLVTDLPKEAFKAGQSLVDVIEEHPIASAVVGSVTAGVLAYEAGKAILGSDTPDLPSSLPPSFTSPAPAMGAGSALPVTPQTQTLQAGGNRSVRRKPKKASSPQRISITNRNINIVGARAS